MRPHTATRLPGGIRRAPRPKDDPCRAPAQLVGLTTAALLVPATALAMAPSWFSGDLQTNADAANGLEDATATVQVVEDDDGTMVRLAVDGIKPSLAGRTLGAHVHIGPCDSDPEPRRSATTTTAVVSRPVPRSGSTSASPPAAGATARPMCPSPSLRVPPSPSSSMPTRPRPTAPPVPAWPASGSTCDRRPHRTAGPLQPERARGPVHLVVDRLDHAGGIVLAGGIAGLLAIGIGSRGAMRLVALTSGAIGTGVRPESGAVPGTITADGTAFLLLAGTFIGVAIALAVLGGLGRWLPAGARARWWATVALTAVIPALGLLDPANEDFRLFGPVWLAIGLFTLLPMAFGAGVATLATRIPTHQPRPARAHAACPARHRRS